MKRTWITLALLLSACSSPRMVGDGTNASSPDKDHASANMLRATGYEPYMTMQDQDLYQLAQDTCTAIRKEGDAHRYVAKQKPKTEAEKHALYNRVGVSISLYCQEMKPMALGS